MKLFTVGIITAIIVASACAVCILTGLNVEVRRSSPEDNNLPPIAENLNPVDAVNGFAFKIYREMFKDFGGSNVFISPYSIFTALAMTYEGARGKTAEEMKGVLCIGQDNESFHLYVKSLYDLFNKNGISTANALWPRTGLQLLQDYVDVIKTYYGGDIKPIDYSDPARASGIINDWIENQTRGKIKDMIPPDAIDPVYTTLILTNAIYFKGIWKIKFDEKNTTYRSFTTQDEKTVQVPTMCLKGVYFNYTENEWMQALELPYRDCNLSMLIILPKKGYNLSHAINQLDENSFSNLIKSMSERKVNVYLPKFEIETLTYRLRKYLENLGMHDAFTPSANFSGIARDVGWIDEVLHKAFVKVDEEGTEAAAATAVVMVMTSIYSGQVKVFDCDHPFMFFIFHKDTGTILFMGCVNDPTNS